MKTTLLAILLALGLVSVASAQTYRRPVGKQEPVRAAPTPPPPVGQARDVRGVVPRAVRGGNPLQMLNPLAPAKYGNAAEAVIYEPYTWKWRGIKLYEITW